MASSTTTGLPAAVDGMDPVSWEAVCRRDAYCRSCHQDVVVCTDALGPGDVKDGAFRCVPLSDGSVCCQLVEPPSDRKVKIWPAAIAGEPIVRLERPGCAYKDAARRAVAMPIEELLAEQHGRHACVGLSNWFASSCSPIGATPPWTCRASSRID